MRNFRAYSPVGEPDICPCCNDVLVIVKRHLSDIGRLLQNDTPTRQDGGITASLDHIRQAGRIMLSCLADDLRKGLIPARPIAFGEAVEAFERAVDDLAARKAPDEAGDIDIKRLSALRSHFSSLHRAVETLVDDCQAGFTRTGL